MTSDPLHVLRNGYRAFGLGAARALLEMFDQHTPGREARWRVFDLTSTSVYPAREIVAEDLFGSIPAHWEVTRVEPDRWKSWHERVAVTGHVFCRPRGGWDMVSLPFAHVWTIVHGRVVSVLSYTDGIEIRRVAETASV